MGGSSKMGNYLLTELQKIDKLARSGEFMKCMEAFNTLIQQFPSEHSLHRKKADVLEDFGKFDDAYQARQELASLEFKEPADLYELALAAWKVENYYDCAAWANKAIFECERNENYYYYQSSIFYQAVAQIATADYDAAASTIENLDDDYSTHVSRLGMISKEHIVLKIESRHSW
ncbi:hypothetical protein NBRC116583_02000 [Arenicella sp. 4NH20-0111]|uniref:hypothetical protein n=1 Tax=Arenicella sp. 4NH20-0111 TaxID=3127648 RepID=UPI003101CB6B